MYRFKAQGLKRRGDATRCLVVGGTTLDVGRGYSGTGRGVLGIWVAELAGSGVGLRVLVGCVVGLGEWLLLLLVLGSVIVVLLGSGV